MKLFKFCCCTLATLLSWIIFKDEGLDLVSRIGMACAVIGVFYVGEAIDSFYAIAENFSAEEQRRQITRKDPLDIESTGKYDISEETTSLLEGFEFLKED